MKTLALVLVSAFCLLAIGCGEVTPQGSAGTGPGEPSGPDSQGTFAGLLKLIPRNDETLKWVSFNDYVRARDSFGIPLPSDDANDEELKEYMRLLDQVAVMARGPFISGFTDYGQRQLKNQRHLAFDIRHVEQSISALYSLKGFQSTVEVVRGHFDPDATKGALGRCLECPDTHREEHLGQQFYSWGGDDIGVNDGRIFQPPAFDDLGRGGHIAVLDSYVFRTVETKAMRSLIDAHLGQKASLADDRHMLLGARHLDDLGVHSAVLLGDVEFLGIQSELPRCDYCTSEERDALKEDAEETVIDEYDVLGTGVGSDEDGLFGALVFVYDDEARAQRNVRLFEGRLADSVSLAHDQPWREIFQEVEVWHQGRTLMAKLRSTDRPRIWNGMLLDRDTLLWYR